MLTTLPKRLAREETRHAALLVAPAVVGAVVIGVVPLFVVFWFSLLDWNSLSGKSTFVGLGNFLQLASDPEFRQSILISAIYTVGLVSLNVVMALSLALLLNQKLRGTAPLRALVFLPAAISLVAWAVIWKLLFQDNGLINSMLAVVGIEGPNWLHEPGPALFAVIVVQLFKNVGLNMTIFLAALQGISRDLLEAASLDGAGRAARFRYITLPSIAPVMFFVVVLTSVAALQVFDSINVLTAGGPGNATSVLVYELYRRGFAYNEIGLGSAIGVVLLAISSVLVITQWHVRRRWVYGEAD